MWGQARVLQADSEIWDLSVMLLTQVENRRGTGLGEAAREGMDSVLGLLEC